MGLVLALPAIAAAAGEYAVAPGSRDNAIHLSFVCAEPAAAYSSATPPEIEVLAVPAWIEKLRLVISAAPAGGLTVFFDVAPGTPLDQCGTLAVRFEARGAGEEALPPVIRRWPLRTSADAPAEQHSYRIEECCLAAAEVEVDREGLPVRHQLVGSEPNPWRASTRIRFGLAEGGAAVTLSIHDVAGRRVRELHTPHLSGGFHQIVWDGSDDAGRSLPPGLYFYELSAGPWTAMGKTLLLR